MQYNWESSIFASSDDVVGGYPFPKLSKNVVIFDIEKIYSVWHQNSYVLDNYLYSGYPPYIFNLSKVFSNWVYNKQELFGYIIPSNCTIYRSGSFAHTSMITELKFPMSVKKLGYYTCYDSNVQTVTLSPLCEFYETTFPENCTKTYYNTVIDSVAFPVTQIVFYVNDDAEERLLGTSATITISDGDIQETRISTNLTISADTSTIGSDKTGFVNFVAYDDSVVATYEFTYSVIPHPVRVSLIPAMTSDTTPSGTVIASGSFSGRLPYYAFDGVDSGTWSSNSWGDSTNKLNGSTDSCYVGYEFENPVIVSDIEISFSSDRQYVGCFQCRVSGEWVTTIDNIQISGTGYTKLSLDLTSNTTCDAIRFCVLSGAEEYFTTNYYGGNVCELIVYGYN